MNNFNGIGRLARDPEIRYSRDNKPIASFSIAIERRFKKDNEPSADFFNCVCFGAQANFTEKYLRKGTKIAFIGEVQNDNYTNKDGQKVYGTKIVVNQIEFAESKGSSESKPTPTTDSNGFMDIDPGLADEVPFI